MGDEASSAGALSFFTRTVLQVPISLYLGWISVATIANICVMSVANDHPTPLPDQLEGTVALIAAAFLLGLAFIVLYGDWVYAGVIIWATFAIGVRNRSGEFLPAKLAVTSVSFALAGALCVVVFITIVRAALIYSGAHASLLHQEWYAFIFDHSAFSSFYASHSALNSSNNNKRYLRGHSASPNKGRKRTNSRHRSSSKV